MLTYFLPDYNNYKIRTKQLPSGSNFMRVDVENMLTNDEYSFLANPGQWSYDQCESIVDISFNLNIPLNVNEGDQYRMFLTPAISSSTTPFTYGEPVWHGSLQVFLSQSVDKPAYVNQIPLDDRALSMDTSNEFIYWDQAPPVPPTTTLAPTTTTTGAPTTSTTTLTPTTSTTTIPATFPVIVYASAIGLVPGNVDLWYNSGSGWYPFDVLGPGNYPNYIPSLTLNIPNGATLQIGVRDVPGNDLIFGVGQASGDSTSRCGIITPLSAVITGSTSLYVNVETQANQYVLCNQTTTTTTGPTTTTTLAPTTSTTTAMPQMINIYLASSGSAPADVRLWYKTNTVLFNDLGLRTPTIYPNYLLGQPLAIPPDEPFSFAVTDAAGGNILFGTGSNSDVFTTNCGLSSAGFLPPFSWTGSINVYINIETQTGSYVSC